jgi:hypothetical protein
LLACYQRRQCAEIFAGRLETFQRYRIGLVSNDQVRQMGFFLQQSLLGGRFKFYSYKKREEPIDYGELNSSLKKSCAKLEIKDVDNFILKCIQLYETTVVRHGLMLVGPTGSGKTKVVYFLFFFYSIHHS